MRSTLSVNVFLVHPHLLLHAAYLNTSNLNVFLSPDLLLGLLVRGSCLVMRFWLWALSLDSRFKLVSDCKDWVSGWIFWVLWFTDTVTSCTKWGRDWLQFSSILKTNGAWVIQYWKHQKGILLWYCSDSDRFDPEQTKESIYWSASYIIMSPPWGCPLPVLCWGLRGSLLMNSLFTCITTVKIWQRPKVIHHYTQTSLQLDRD